MSAAACCHPQIPQNGECALDAYDFLRHLFDVAVAAAQPHEKFAGLLPPKPAGRTIVVGGGKAAASMAQAFEAAWAYPLEGLVVTRYGHRVPTSTIEVVEASHPIPDEAGVEATRRILDLARSAGPDDLVVCLLSGGASSLLCLPGEGLTLADKQTITCALLELGAPIAVVNRIRKALSAIKGGRLAAAAAPARLATYVISDVPGDDPADVGSGPIVPDPVDPSEARMLLERYGVAVPRNVAQALDGSGLFANMPDAAEIHVLASCKMALDAAAAVARSAQIAPLLLGDAIEGEAREVGVVMAGIAKSVARFGEPVSRPCVLLSGGETTVTMRGNGRGGRNTEFLLSLARALNGEAAISAIACDTDGIDGSENNAGAWFDERFVREASETGLSLDGLLARNDAYSAFAALDRLVVTGPTLTNVNDFRAIFIR